MYISHFITEAVQMVAGIHTQNYAPAREEKTSFFSLILHMTSSKSVLQYNMTEIRTLYLFF